MAKLSSGREAPRDYATRAINVVTAIRNALVPLLPGERPAWLVLELKGSYPARKPARRGISRFLPLRQDQTSQQEFEAQVSSMLRSPWLLGVVLRIDGLSVDPATAYFLRRQVVRLRESGKRVVAYAVRLDDSGYYVASAAERVVMPHSAELQVTGTSLGATFIGAALKRAGVRLQKLAVDEYKNAGDQFARESMSDAQREQYQALLDSFGRTYETDVGDGRDVSQETVRAWIDEGVTSAARAQHLGMIDQVAYEDEVLAGQHRPYRDGSRYMPAYVRVPGSGVAVVSLVGTIALGSSRRFPLPLPLFGEATAGAETLVRALRAAGKDPRTAAVVFHVDSGGGSALASDLIGREVELLARRMPVVAVMGQVAGSGGYYVLTHATEVIAAPNTITGSIGVVTAKLVLEEFNARHGLNPEYVSRGRFAELMSSARPFDPEESAMLERYLREVYERFVARVAAGRKLDAARVDELGRGRLWSGADALELGLVDALGDVSSAIERARVLAGLHRRAGVWNVEAPARLLLPNPADPAAWLRDATALLDERALLLHTHDLSLTPLR